MSNSLENTGRKQGLNSNVIKFIAIIAMTIDHLTWTFFPGYQTDALPLLLHIIGRITAPIMCYFIAEGYFYTRNLKKYIIRLFVFAIISHFAYALLFGKNIIPFKTSIFDQTSVIWALAWGLVALAVMQSENQRLKPWLKNIIVILCCVMAFCADWSCIATLVIVHMGTNRGKFKTQMVCLVVDVAMYAVIYSLFINVVYGIIQMTVVLAIPILYFYNGERGKWKGMKWLFYFYYPAHLTILGLIKMFVLCQK